MRDRRTVPPPPALNSSAPMSQAERVSPSMSMVNVPERSVPAPLRADPVTRWKSSDPAVTFVKFVVSNATEFIKPVSVEFASPAAHVVNVHPTFADPPSSHARTDPWKYVFRQVGFALRPVF